MDTPSQMGLTSSEALARYKRDGGNTLVTERRQSAFLTFLTEFKNPILLVLIGAAVIALATGSTVSGVLIITIVLVSSVLDFFISFRSQQAARLLAKRVESKARVVRDGAAIELSHESLVVGDLVLLEAGSVVPADGVVLETEALYINESALTGESLPVEKTSRASVYMGSGVVSGAARIEVTATGGRTKFASIAALLTERERPSEFESGIKKFSILLTKVIVILVVCIFLINAFLKHDLFTSIIFSLALAVGLTPDLLPVIIAVNLSRASLRMSKKGVIVKKLSAIENFGSMDILCTDKTGTLTEDHIVLVRYVSEDGAVSERVLEAAYVSSALKGSAKTPLDAAILERQEFAIASYTKLHEIPFDFERKRDTMVVQKKGDGILLITKGAPEEILKACRIDEKVHAQATKEFETLSRDGYRVIAVATKELANKAVYSSKDEYDLSFAGFIAFIDPPKPDTKRILEELMQKSIEIKVVTGDHRAVAEHILSEVGVVSKGTLDGEEIETLEDDALAARAEGITIFSRVTPIQKNRIIRALQSRGHTVGYMGDGINDAPALRSSDVGISVSNALDVAKESADIVLTSKDLQHLLQGVKEGRKTFANTQKYISMAVSSNFGNMISMTGASIVLPFLPMLPTQILLNNLLYETSQIALIADHVDEHILNRPSPWDIRALTRFMLVFGLLSSVFDFLVFYTLYKVFGFSGSMFQTAWFIQSFFSQVFAIFFIRTAHAVWKVHRPHRLVMLSAFLTTGVAWWIALGQLGHYFGFTPIPGFVIGSMLTISFVYFASIEVVKKFFYHRLRTHRQPKKSWLEHAR